MKLDKRVEHFLCSIANPIKFRERLENGYDLGASNDADAEVVRIEWRHRIWHCVTFEDGTLRREMTVDGCALAVARVIGWLEGSESRETRLVGGCVSRVGKEATTAVGAGCVY